MNVLIIEDDLIWQAKFQMLLEGCEITNIFLANTVETAKKMLNNNKVDLIVADIMLENETVFELYKYHSKALATPTIIISSLANNENYKNAELIDQFLFLQKDFLQNTFKSAVNLLSAKFVNATIEKTGNDKRLIQHQFNEVFKMINDTNLLQKFNMDTLETEIIVQRLQHNKTYSEIATEIGLSDERARKLFYRSLKKLKAKIKNASERYNHFLEFTTLKKNKIEINATLTAQNNSAKIIAKEDYLTQSIDELELLGTKWKNVLHEKNIHYIADLVNLNKRELALFPKFGVFAVSQIELELSKNGFELKK